MTEDRGGEGGGRTYDEMALQSPASKVELKSPHTILKVRTCVSTRCTPVSIRIKV